MPLYRTLKYFIDLQVIIKIVMCYFSLFSIIKMVTRFDVSGLTRFFRRFGLRIRERSDQGLLKIRGKYRIVPFHHTFKVRVLRSHLFQLFLRCGLPAIEINI